MFGRRGTMKNIETILTESGVTATEEQIEAIKAAVSENYKTVTDYDKQKAKLETAEEQVKTLSENLEGFKGIDPKEIETLKATIEAKDKELADKLAERDFNDSVKEAIRTAKGKNEKAITALLDIEALKKSKNQKEDIAAALKTLSEAEDSKFLFGETEVVGNGNFIGNVTKNTGDSGDAALRAAMGLPPLKSE